MESVRKSDTRTQTQLDAQPRLRGVPPPPPDANGKANKAAATEDIHARLARLSFNTPGVKVSAAQAPSMLGNTDRTNLSELANKLRVQEKLLDIETKAQKIQQELSAPGLKFFREQAQERYNKLRAQGLLFQLPRLLQRKEKLDTEIRNLNQEQISTPEASELRAKAQLLAEVIQWATANPTHMANFDKGIELLGLNEEKAALKETAHTTELVTRETVGLLQKKYSEKLQAERNAFDKLSIDISALIARTRNPRTITSDSLSTFDKEAATLTKALQGLTDPDLVQRAKNIIERLPNDRAVLEEEIRTATEEIKNRPITQTAARSTPPPLPAAKQPATPPPLPAQRTPTAPAVQIQTPPTAAPATPPPPPAKALAHRTQPSTNTTAAPSNDTQVPVAPPAAAASAPRRATPPPLPNNLSQATRVKIPVIDNNPTQADLPIPVIETPPRSVPTLPQISPAAPRRAETRFGQASVPVSALETTSNNAPEAVASPSPAQDTVLSAAETNLNLGQITKELQTYAQQVISQFPHQPVPAEAIARWQSDVEEYLAQHGRQGDQQLVLSMMTLFDAHNKQTKTIRGRFGALKAWAQDKLSRPEKSEAATPPPELVPEAQVIDTFLAKYNLSDQDKILIKIAIGQSLRDLDTININQVVAKLNSLMQRRREILQQIAAAHGRPMSQEEIAEHARRDSTVLSDLSKKKFALSEVESTDLVKEAKLYSRTRDKFFQSIEKSALPSQAVADMLENNLLTSPLAIALQDSLEALENTDNNLVGTPALQKALAETDALFFGAPNVAYALKRRIEHMAKVHDSQKAAASIAALDMRPKEATTQIKIPLPEVKLPLAAEAPEPSQDTPTTTIEAHATDPRDAIFKADPDTAFSEAIHFLEADGATEIANKLADLNSKIEQLFALAFKNFDAIHKSSIKGYFQMIDNILGEKYKDIADALYRKLHQRWSAYNTATKVSIEAGEDEQDAPVSPNIAANDDEEIPRPRSTLQQVDNRLGEEARILHFQTLETAAISAITNETEPYQILDKLMDVYRNEPNIIDKLKAITTALPQSDVSGAKHQVTFSEAYLIGKKIDSIPNISSTLNGLLIRKMGAVLDKWNTEASQQSASGEYQQAA